MSLRKYATLCLAVAHQLAAQLVDDSWKGPGHVYMIQGDDYNRPDDPFPLEIGCVNVNGKLTADNSNCAVFEANVTHLLSDAGECGWKPRDDNGGQPYIMTCTTPTPSYHGIYRLNNKREPIYLSYGAGEVGWSVDGTPTGDQIYDIYWGAAAPIKGILLWSPV
ncbi:hypothetical protein SLS62_003520 [Diatrype stigma]|uniref:Uncharacterized protein n=1 Tax=Diatrype stigma TaxID=117547 RepID=A0AAN9USP4_9PEZI